MRINVESRLLTCMMASALDSSFRAIDERVSPRFTVYSVLRGEGSFEKKDLGIDIAEKVAQLPAHRRLAGSDQGVDQNGTGLFQFSRP